MATVRGLASRDPLEPPTVTTDGIIIERGEHAQEFVIIGNAEARDTRLSFRARGLHHHLLSLPQGWRVTTTDLARDNREGRDAIRTALSELVALRYVIREKRQDARGRWHTIMTVHGKPQPETDSQAPVTEDGFPGVGKPGVGESGAKDLKTVTENGKDQKMAQERASRRAQASGSRAERTTDEVLAEVRQAVAAVHGHQQADGLTDGQVLGLYFAYANPKKPARDLVAYMTKVLGDAPYVETFLANAGAVCVACWHWESNCACGQAAAPAA
jgi:hypothetical protein